MESRGGLDVGGRAAPQGGGGGAVLTPALISGTRKAILVWFCRYCQRFSQGFSQGCGYDEHHLLVIPTRMELMTVFGVACLGTYGLFQATEPVLTWI